MIFFLSISSFHPACSRPIIWKRWSCLQCSQFTSSCYDGLVIGHLNVSAFCQVVIVYLVLKTCSHKSSQRQTSTMTNKIKEIWCTSAILMSFIWKYNTGRTWFKMKFSWHELHLSVKPSPAIWSYRPSSNIFLNSKRYGCVSMSNNGTNHGTKQSDEFKLSFRQV